MEMVADGENLKIAWRYWTNAGDLEQLQKMVDALWRLYDGRGWYQDALGLTTDLLQVLSSTSSSPEQAQQEIMLQTTLARALLAMKGYTFEVEQAYARALQLSEQYGEIPQLFPVLRGLSSYYMFRTEFEKSLRMGEKILELADNMDDDQMRMHGYLVVGICTGYLSSVQKALEILEKGIALYNPDRRRAQRFQIGNEPGIVCHMASAFHLWWLGYPDRAHDRAAKALELATKLNHPFTKAYILFHKSLIHMWMREYHQALSDALLMGEIASEQDFPLWKALSSILHGAIKTVLGQTEEGVTQLENGLKSYLDHNSPPVFWPDLTGLRAMTYSRAGRPAEGLRLIQELLVEDRTAKYIQTIPYAESVHG